MIYPPHPFADYFPMLPADELAALAADIKTNGLLQPIMLFQDMILDGRNRLAACELAKVAPRFETFVGDYDAALQFVVSANVRRRHLSPFTRGELALKLKPIVAERAKERMSEGGEKAAPGRPAEKGVAELPHLSTGKTRDVLASRAGMSGKTLDKVEAILESPHFTPEIEAKLAAGDVAIDAVYTSIKKQAELQTAKADIVTQSNASVADNRPRLYVVDCVEFIANHNGKVDLLITDPPYSTDVEDLSSFLDEWYFDALNMVKDTGFAYIFIGAYPDEVFAYLNHHTPCHIKLEQILVWTYRNTLGNNPKERYKLNYQNCLFFRGINAPDLACPVTNEQWAVQDINAPDGRQGDRYHAWQKPMEIAERFIRHTTKKGDLIFDPFACTGTFLLAGSKLGREAFGCEIDANAAIVAKERGCDLVAEV